VAGLGEDVGYGGPSLRLERVGKEAKKDGTCGRPHKHSDRAVDDYRSGPLPLASCRRETAF